MNDRLVYSRGRFTVAQAIDLPVSYSSGVQATAVSNAVLNKFQPKEFNDTKVMFVRGHGPGLIHTSKKKISKMEDLTGLKLRGTGTSRLIQKALASLRLENQ